MLVLLSVLLSVLESGIVSIGAPVWVIGGAVVGVFVEAFVRALVGGGRRLEGRVLCDGMGQR